MALTLRPVGFVRNGVLSGGREIRWENIESEIVIDPEWVDALDGVEGFSHLWVIFYLSQSPLPKLLRTRPKGRADAPLVGRFATRSPARPNPIGLTPVELLAVEGGCVRVRGLDAFDGTPVLDLKPYLPRGDSLPHARVPDWLNRLTSDDDRHGENHT
ncbi:MAG: tRNA (N6-threonylcarbamoyladenosine(37)-N6)-methyltransferase TrmO [Anaerolineales bacterium]|nr:MAG: tRNA (N6-threonylcarbamoyladenosine(37)-N6)-methyltransferase TrmO [Anaerolineales bacterium]